MSWNLPDGVTGNMIPGDRPEDEVVEAAFEKYEDTIEAAAHWIRHFHCAVIQQTAEENIAEAEALSQHIADLASDLYNETGGLIRLAMVQERIREVL